MKFLPLALLPLLLSTLQAAERPAVTQPRQTSGDKAVQPAWEQTLTLTVGNQDADIVGHDQRAIQAAVDQVARFGGGTVHIKAGTYRLLARVFGRRKRRPEPALRGGA